MKQSFRIKVQAPREMMMQQPGLAAYLYIDGRHISGSVWSKYLPGLEFNHLYVNEGGKQYSAELVFATLVGQVLCGIAHEYSNKADLWL